LKRGPQGGASAEAAAAVDEGRRRQDQLAAMGLHAIVRALEEARCKPVVAALLVNRAGWITDLLKYSVSWPENVPVAEGLAIRDALRFAFRECRVAVAELDEKSLPDLAANTLETSSMAIDARLKALGATYWLLRGQSKRALPTTAMFTTSSDRLPAVEEAHSISASDAGRVMRPPRLE
jgi:hypothetical protein